jgi:hypothetical protein
MSIFLKYLLIWFQYDFQYDFYLESMSSSLLISEKLSLFFHYQLSKKFDLECELTIFSRLKT